jgi:hypothetical protein
VATWLDCRQREAPRSRRIRCRNRLVATPPLARQQCQLKETATPDSPLEADRESRHNGPTVQLPGRGNFSQQQPTSCAQSYHEIGARWCPVNCNRLLCRDRPPARGPRNPKRSHRRHLATSSEAVERPHGPPLARLAPLRKDRGYVARPVARERPREVGGFVFAIDRSQRPLLHGTNAN